jgi:hypothetical protein
LVEAFSAGGAELFRVVFYDLEEGVYGFVVDAIDALFAFAFEVDKVALEEGFEVVADHALLLPQNLGEFVDAEGFFCEFLEGGESCGVGEVGEESVAKGGESRFHVFHASLI